MTILDILKNLAPAIRGWLALTGAGAQVQSAIQASVTVHAEDINKIPTLRGATPEIQARAKYLADVASDAIADFVAFAGSGGAIEPDGPVEIPLPPPLPNPEPATSDDEQEATHSESV